MGQEEVSVMGDSFIYQRNFVLTEKLIKDNIISGKEIIMKTNGKKRIFALLLCVMMIGSSMSAFAALRYNSMTIGPVQPEQAFCELLLDTNYGQAFTTPNTVSISVSTAIAVLNKSGKTYSSSGTRSAYVSVANTVSAASTHQAGIYNGTLYL